MNRIQKVLDRLQEEEEDKNEREYATRNSWFAFLFRRGESPEEKEARERRATERRTGRIVREAEFHAQKVRFEWLRDQRSNLDLEIAIAEYNKMMEEHREVRRQQEWQERERMRRNAEEERRMQENLRGRRSKHRRHERQRRGVRNGMRDFDRRRQGRNGKRNRGGRSGEKR